MAPIAVEAARPKDAGLMAQAVAARFRRIPSGTPAVRAGTVPSTGCDVAAGHDGPARRGGRAPIGPTIAAREVQALCGATAHALAASWVSAKPWAFATLCATGIGVSPGFARLACVPSIALPATRLDQVGSSCAMVADAAPSDAAIALHTA